MTKKLTAEEKIAKTLEYCDFVKDLAHNSNCTVNFQIEIENTNGETETEQQHAENKCIGYITNSRDFLYWCICRAVEAAKQQSQNFNNLSSVRVWIKTYDTLGELVDEKPVNDYEINFERGVEI